MFYYGVGRCGLHQTVACTTAAAGTSAVMSAGVMKVRIVATTDTFVTTNSVTATTALGIYLPGLSAEYFTVTPGQTISGISVSAAGNLDITEIS